MSDARFSTDGGPGLTVSNEIIELNPDEGLELETDRDTDDLITLDAGDLGVLADILSEIGADNESALLEIERRHLAENNDHTIRFRAKDLTEIAVALTVGHTISHYARDEDTMWTIERFGKLIKQTAATPKAVEYNDLEFPGMVTGDGQGDEIRPFDVIAGEQMLHFTDQAGDLVPLSEPERLPFTDDEREEHPADEHFETITPE